MFCKFRRNNFQFFIHAGVAFNFKYPFLYLLTALIAGMLCSDYLTLPVYFFYTSLVLALLFFKISKNLTDILLLSLLFYVGWLIPSHPLQVFEKEAIYPIYSRCEEKLPHNNYILSVHQQRFYLSNLYTDTTYQIGDSLLFYSRISPLHQHTNPGEFSYARYLKQKNVYNQLIPYTKIESNGHSHNVVSFFNTLREQLLAKTARLTKDSISRTLINALCLGYTNDLDSEFRNLFITTGTVHLLSVSGLHTGAIYLFILFAVRHTGLSGRKTELCVLPLLWCYACLTGLSPSVVRASVILSFITIGKAFNRTYNPINSLAASAFFTLLVRPSTLYSLSFLLSYSAYAGILIIYPVLYRLRGTLSAFPSKIYACFCVTISAQIPTLPISAFYFHTININGFLANLIAVPLSTLLLYCSSICLIIPEMVSRYLIIISELLCKILVYFLRLFTPISINIQGLYPSAGTLILIYGCLIFTGFLLLQRKKHWLYAITISLCLLFINLIISNKQLSSKREVVIFHYYRQTAILLNHNGYYLILENSTDDPAKMMPYILKNKLKPLPPAAGILQNDLFWHNSRLYHGKDTLFIVSKHHPLIRPCNTLVITDNQLPVTSTDPVAGSIHPQEIIADGSNNKYTIKKWYEFCKKYNISFRNTSETGFVCLPLK